MPAHTQLQKQKQIKIQIQQQQQQLQRILTAIEIHIPAARYKLQSSGCTGCSHILNYELALIQRVIKIAI